MPDRAINIPTEITSNSEEDTQLIGRTLSKSLRRGDIVALFGDLGSGKTRFVQGMCSGLSVQEPVVSPTFTIVNQYNGLNGDQKRLKIQHVDCYRLTTTDELVDIGAEELLSSDDIIVVEWPQLVLPLIRGVYWEISIELGELETQRIIKIGKKSTGANDDSRN